MRAAVLVVVLAGAGSSLVACRALPEPAGPIVAPVGHATAAPVQAAEAVAADAGAPSAAATEESADDAVHPCDGASGEGKAAQAAIEALDARISRLAEDADPKPVAAELDALLRTECFRMSSADTSHPRFETALSLRTWWQDGGEQWLGHYVGQDEKRNVVIPPTPRKALFATTTTAKPLVPLLCPPGSTSCGRETIGWMRRADQSLERRAKSRGYGRDVTAETCAKDAEKEEPESRYAHFRDCLEGVAIKREALPLGRFKAPSEGWLLLRDAPRVRVNSAVCETLRAYDLASGAAYVIEECTPSVGTPHTMKTRTGRVGVAALREAAWMLAMTQVSEGQVRTKSETFEVPEPIVIQRPSSQSLGHSYLCGSSGSSSFREWSWMRADKKGALEGQMSGRLRSVGSAEATAHALELLAIVDDGFEAGCTPAPPPARVAWTEAGPALAPHTGATLSGPELEGARAALGQTRSPGTCQKAP